MTNLSIQESHSAFEKVFENLIKAFNDELARIRIVLVVLKRNKEFWDLAVFIKELSTCHSRATALNAFTRRSRHSEL